MKAFKENFKRYETKYILSKEIWLEMQEQLKEHLLPDEHATSTISNIYFDTPDYQMVRNSMDKPLFKEKLRMRSYDPEPNPTSPVFIEIKKKFQKVVYKRRLTTSLKQGQAYLFEGEDSMEDSQIKQEIDWLVERYGKVEGKMYIYYDRYSMKGIENEEVRITIDHNLLYRNKDLDLSHGIYGDYLLSPDKVIMEIKIPGAYPLWLTEILAQYQLYPSSFSKYGTAYQKVTAKGGKQYA